MRTCALILAGGASRRMGRNKLLMSRRPGSDQTVLGHVISVVAGITREVTVVTSPDGAEAAAVCAKSNANVVTDAHYYEGPLQALQQAWPMPVGTDCDTVLVLAGDLPGLVPAVLLLCLERLQAASADTDGVLVRREGRWQPLLGCYRMRAGQAFRDVAATGEQRLLPVFNKLKLDGIDAEAAGWPTWWTRPVHTPEDYQLWLAEKGD